MKQAQLGAAAGALATVALLLWWSQPARPAPTAHAVERPTAPVSIRTSELEASEQAAPEACSGSFVTHRLDFATGTRAREIGTYLSNGAGVAANDLDNDGDLDLVFASVDGQSAILWNEGGLQFRTEELEDRLTRGVATVDIDGDGNLDIVFTHRGLEPPSYWRNQGNGVGAERFLRMALPGVDGYAYAMGWGDVDADGDLDLVTGSYGVELKQSGIADPLQDARAGLAIYLREGDRFVRRQLDPAAETLSIALFDLDGDGREEIWAANDFADRDQVWERDGQAWKRTDPFAATSHSTMSTDWGDLANNGQLALFSTDMNPYDISPQTLAQWLPMMKQLGEQRTANDPQLMSNVLLVAGGSTGALWQDTATARSVGATGWSWAGRFGDLDRDGFLDLYVVNGMIAANLFAYLPNNELVEENQAFRNRGDGSFVPAQTWQLGSTASGRGMVMADMDGDGDLDIVVNNLRSFAQLFENQLCSGSGLEVALQQPQGGNYNAVGAVVRLYTRQGSIQQRDVRASGGYLSGDPLRLHFGLPEGANPAQLEIVWPDGALSRVEGPAANTRIVVTRQ